MKSIYSKSKKIFITLLIVIILSSCTSPIFAATSKTSSSSAKRISLILQLISNLSTRGNNFLNRLSIALSKTTTNTSKTITIPDYAGPGYKSCYNTLNSNCQKLYRYLYSKKTDFIDGNTIDLKYFLTNYKITTSEVFKTINALEFDHPEFYYIISQNTYYISYSASTLNLHFKNISSSLKNNLNRIDSIVNSIVIEANKKSNDYQKIKYVHDYIYSNMSYELSQALSIDGFITKKGQCQTYAFMFKYVMNKLGIDCVYVHGFLPDGGGHAWNHVKLNGNWYMIDVCWDDCLSSYEYFLKGKSVLNGRTINCNAPTLCNTNY